MKILFLCTANMQRSKTAEELFQALDDGNIYRSAGLSEKYVTKANSILCNEEMLQWADKVYVFENTHILRIEKYTGSKYLQKIINLNIPDNYQYFQRELVLLILRKVNTSD